jgi:asparagine N-glycosylation enzyme membrane subunit Stt3
MNNDRASSFPVLLAAPAVALALAALLVSSFAWHWAGWLLGSIVTSALVVIYRVLDRRASLKVRYVRDARLSRLANMLLVSGLILGSVNAFWIATELAK